MRRLLPLLILLLGALALYIDFWPGESGLGSGSQFFLLSNINSGTTQQLQTKLGLDLEGGFEITYQAVDGNGHAASPSGDQLNVIRSIMEQRVNALAVSEPIVETVGSNEIRVQVPGAANPDEVRNLVGKTGQLSFVLMDPNVYGDATGKTGTKSLPTQGSTIDLSQFPAADIPFTGADLDTSGIGWAADPAKAGNYLINFKFNSATANAFASWTGAHINDYFAIVLDNKVESVPYIKDAITGGQGQITGTFSIDEAKNLATILQYGALPYPVAEISYTNVPATLGASFLNQTLFAGAIGIGLVALFMLIYYRLPGVIAVLALAYYGVAVLAIFRIIPVTLTLAGIAGFVLSVGMAVDANILIFERTKEELRTGKTLPSAVEAGFNRAWNSIFDSNVSSLITASILYFGGSSTIKGFALVLIIGIATSMFTAVTVSRTLLRFVVLQNFAQKAWLFGVTDEEFQARAATSRFTTRREARGRV